MTFSWVACKALTGEVIVDLPLLEVDEVVQTIERYETVTGKLPVDTEHAPNQWQRALKEGASFIVLLSETPDASGNVVSTPVWGAMPVQVSLSEADEAEFTLLTLEGYLDRQFISSAKTYAATDQNSIVADLITSFVGSAVGGIPIRVQVVGGAGMARDQTYADQDDKTVYSALQDLTGKTGGPEWYVGWEHQSNPERYTPVLYVGNRLGQVGFTSEFEMPGSVTAFQLTRDFSDGKGANNVMAYSSGTGTVRPQSPKQTFTDPDRPKFEYRWTPSTSITDVNTLTDYASNAVGTMRDGAITVTMTASTMDPQCPQLGTDWNLGDDIGITIGGVDQNGVDLVPSVPGGLQVSARVIGYTLTLGETPMVTPVLLSAQIT